MAAQCALSLGKLREIITLSIAIKIAVLCSIALTTGCDLLTRPPAPSAAEYCGIQLDDVRTNDQVLSVWAPDARQHCFRYYAPVLAARKLANISVVAAEKNINREPFFTLLNTAAMQQQAPDLAFVHHGPALQQLADSGYLYPIEMCNLGGKDWTNPIFRQRQWGYPFEVETLLLFYSKRILRQLGWDNARIEKVPADIAAGKTGLLDLLTIARQAVDAKVVKKGFAFTVHDERFYSTMHLFSSFGGHYTTETAHQDGNRDALNATFDFYSQLRKSGLMHPSISQADISSVTNRFAIRDALANGRILFAHTTASEWKRMLLDHVQDETHLRNNIGIALLPAAKGSGSAIMSFMGSYVIFSAKATGKRNQAASCEVIRQIAAADLHKRHASNITQLAPDGNGIWSPTPLPTITLDSLFRNQEHHSGFAQFYEHINKTTALLAKNKITVDQATELTYRELQRSLQ